MQGVGKVGISEFEGSWGFVQMLLQPLPRAGDL